jgi:hypothetical protein
LGGVAVGQGGEGKDTEGWRGWKYTSCIRMKMYTYDVSQSPLNTEKVGRREWGVETQ